MHFFPPRIVRKANDIIMIKQPTMILKMRKKISFREIININIRRLKLCPGTFFCISTNDEDIRASRIKKTLCTYTLIPINIRTKYIPNTKCMNRVYVYTKYEIEYL